jgi:multiple sugar transport system permease protein
MSIKFMRDRSAYPSQNQNKKGFLKEYYTPFFMVTPAALFILSMILFPVIYSIVLSVVKWTPGDGIIQFVGLENFFRMFQDDIFWKSFKNTIFLFIVCLIFETVIGIYLGNLLSKEVPGQKLFQALILLPSIIASVAVGMMWIIIYDPTLGIANFFLKTLGFKPLAWLGDPKIVLISLAIIDIWQWTPFMALIITGGMRALPTDPFEAAEIDGASKWQTFIYITLPLLRPVIVVAMLLRTVDLIRFFDTVYIMTKGGPNYASSTLNVYSYLQGFNYMDMSYGSAIMIFLLMLVMFVSYLFTLVRRRVS